MIRPEWGKVVTESGGACTCYTHAVRLNPLPELICDVTNRYNLP